MRSVHFSFGRTAVLASLFLTGIVGCENKEKILDIDTPDGGVEVERSQDTGEVDIKIDD